MECLCLSILIITSPSYKLLNVLRTSGGSFNQPLCLCILRVISPVLSSVLMVKNTNDCEMVKESSLFGPSCPESHETKKMCQIKVIIGPFVEKELQFFLLVWALACTRLKICTLCLFSTPWMKSFCCSHYKRSCKVASVGACLPRGLFSDTAAWISHDTVLTARPFGFSYQDLNI